MFHRCYECPALQTEQDVQVSQERQANSLHTAFSLVHPQFCQQVHSSSHAQFCGTIGWSLGGQRRTWLRSTMRRTSGQRPTGQCRATCCQGKLRAMARTPWQGSSPWTRSRCTSTAKVPLRRSTSRSARPWEQGVPLHMSGAGFLAPSTRSGQSKSRATPHSATWRLGALPTFSKGETISLTPLQRREQTHTSLLSGCQNFRCLCFAGQASGAVGSGGSRPAQVQRMERRLRPPRARTKRKRREVAALPATGQASSWLSPIFPSPSSQDSLDPRSFRGHSMQLERVFDHGGRALGRAIIFCAKCGAVYWERAAPQIEVWAVSKQTLSWLDSGRRSTTFPGRGNNTGGAVGILRGGGVNDQLVSKLALKAGG